MHVHWETQAPGYWSGVRGIHTLDGDVQLGEFRRFSVAEISDSGRLRPPLFEEWVGVVLEMRSGSVIWIEWLVEHSCDAQM